MFRFVAQGIKNRWLFSLLFSTAVCIILMTIPVTLSSLQNTVALVEADIQQYGRGSYDILVRPAGTRNNVEQSFGVVEENYLAAGDGGISEKEWQVIKEMNDVDVAAPVASLGYFTGESKTFSLWMHEQSERVTTQFYTTDGVKRYPIGTPRIAVALHHGQEPVDFIAGDDPSVFNYLMKGYPAQFMFPETYHLLVGIDPESEERLTGISFDAFETPLSGEALSWLQFAGDAPIVKVIKLTDPVVPIIADVTIETLDLNGQQLTQFRDDLNLNSDQSFAEKVDTAEYKNLFRYLQEYPAKAEHTYEFDFSHKLDPFKSDALGVTKEHAIIENNEYGYHANYGNTAKHYSSSRMAYDIEQSSNTLSVKQQGNMNGVPTYRHVEKKGGSFYELRELPFVLYPIGEYSVEDVQNQLAASPLGIYQLAPVKLVNNQLEDAIEETEMHPTIVPGSFVPAPAHGVVTMEGAEIIKGEKPIDAIRVRVAGITDYTEEAAAKIERVAGEIAQMGYEVDVVAGASHQQMEVKVEGLGTVLEPWTTLGAAASIVSGWDGTTFLLALAFSIVALIYLLSRLTFWRVSKQPEVQLLHQLGWGKRPIRRLLRGELAVLSGLAWLLSLICLMVIQLGWAFSSFIYVLHFAVFACVVLFLFLAVAWKWRQLTTLQNSDHLTAPRQSKTDRKQRKPVAKSRRQLVATNIRHFRGYILSPFIQLGLVSALSTFVYLSLHETVDATNLTLLGQHVNFQVSGLHLVIVTSAYAVALFTVMETMASQLAVRKREVGTLRAIGWEHRHIFRLLLAEVAVWAGVAAMLGNGIGLCLYGTFYPINFWSFSVTVLSLIGFFALILLVSGLVIRRFVKQELTGTFVLRRHRKFANKNAEETV